MKVYNCECLGCGAKGDRIVKGNEIIRCSKCNQTMSKVGGPIGGSGILPLAPGQPDRFIAFESQTLGRKISTEIELIAAYEEMYGVKAVTPPPPVIPKVELKAKQEQEPRKAGRPKKKLEIEEDDDKDDEKDED